MESPGVTGAILVDSSSGLCLGAAGKAIEEDAPALLIAGRRAVDTDGVGVVKVRGW